MLKVLIIDDEKDARAALEVLLQKFVKNVEVIGHATGVKSGLEQIAALKPAVVFLDINMEDGTGFDLLDELEEFNFHLVFVTAFNQYAIKAFKYSAFDYLLKPVDLQELRKCVERIRASKLYNNESRIKELKTSHKQGRNTKLTLPNFGGFDIIEIKEIIRCEGQKNYTTFYLRGGNKIVVSQTLKEYEMLLEDHDFMRVFQSHLVNLDCVQKYIRGRGGELIMEDGATVPVSRDKKDELLSKLKA